MIKSLRIKNYALIQSLEMEPSDQLNIITGETGAGKSIMLGAVGLLLGNRADTKALFSENEKCVVEGVFDIGHYQIKSLFDHEELDYEIECIIRREISPSGKSRAFVNDTPVTLDILKTLGTHLMDIHSQHESLHLANNHYQLEILDIYAGNQKLLKDYQDKYREFKSLSKKYHDLQKLATESAQETDYQQFLFDELEKANLQPGELETLEEELNVLENAEEIKVNLGQLNQLLDESEFSLINQMKEALPLLASIKKFSTKLEELYERINSASIELSDIADELSREQEHTELDPERLQIVKDRIDLINRLQQKHSTASIDELIKLREELSAKLEQILNIDDQIESARKSMEAQESKMLEAGKKLTESRVSNAPGFSSAIETLIRKLGIENGVVQFQINPSEASDTGLDLVEMLFSANKGVSPKEIKSVASGGEFSRLIFSVKYLIADKTALPTVIFDEIDTGVSGEIAIQMVNMMKQMASNHQVIAISHLPQFAAKGDTHYFVYKDHSSDRSVSKVRKLESQDRVMAIAQMIGGDNPGDSAIESARDLIAASSN